MKDEAPVAGVVVEGVVFGVCCVGVSWVAVGVVVVVDGVVVAGVVVAGVVVGRRGDSCLAPAAQKHQRDHDHDAEHRRDHEPGDDPPPLDDRTSCLCGVDRPGRRPACVVGDRDEALAGGCRVVTLVVLGGVLAPVVVRDVAEPVVGRLLAGSAASSAGGARATPGTRLLHIADHRRLLSHR